MTATDELSRMLDELRKLAAKADVDGCIDWANRIRKLAKEREHE